MCACSDAACGADARFGYFLRRTHYDSRSTRPLDNTSAANGFTLQTNGNRGAGNVSKIDVHSLLYTGATTKVYAALMMWWGQSSHINIGYTSTDPAQIKSQVEDMISRGINGVIIAWYGPNNAVDQATKLLMAEAEAHPGFTFAIMIDHGAIEWDSCSGCTPQQALTAQMQYFGADMLSFARVYD